jgi:hypothetical protein
VYCSISPGIGGRIALNLAGRFSVIVAIRPSTP